MRLACCKRCKFGEDAAYENGVKFVACRAMPERPIVVENQVHWSVPPKNRESWCGLFRLSLWKLFKGNGA